MEASSHPSDELIHQLLDVGIARVNLGKHSSCRAKEIGADDLRHALIEQRKGDGGLVDELDTHATLVQDSSDNQQTLRDVIVGGGVW